jgi:hypothetical protein
VGERGHGGKEYSNILENRRMKSEIVNEQMQQK